MGALRCLHLINVEFGRPIGYTKELQQPGNRCASVCVCMCVWKREREGACTQASSVVEDGRDVESGRSVTNYCMRVCWYACASRGVTGERNMKMWRRRSEETWKKNKTKISCYSVWPARALRISLAGVTVPDPNWRDTEINPNFPEWLLPRALEEDCAHFFSFTQRQTVSVSV